MASGTAEPPLIQASGLVKHYGPVRAVDGVSFAIGRGEIVGFLGPNGAGKSTTMRMLTGFLHPDRGEVRIAGRALADGPRIALEARSEIGYLPEHTPLYRGMRVDRYLAFVAEVRGFSGAAKRDAIERVVDACDLSGYTRRRAGTLSKGYRQRVGLAQALIADPSVLILDEPTSGLDPGEIVRIRDLVTTLAREKTILLSTHVLPEVEEVCRRVLILAGGRVVADGGLLELAAAEAERLSVIVGPGTASVDAAEAVLAGVEGVSAVLRGSRGRAGEAQWHLVVAERYAVAERVSRAVQDAGLALFELRHDVPTLESVFLSHTRGGGGAA